MELALIVVQGALREVEQMKHLGGGPKGLVEHISHGDRAPKRLRVEGDDASKLPPEIVTAPSGQLQEVLFARLTNDFCCFSILSFFVSQEAKSYMKGVKDGLNQMLNIIHEETEESVTLAWRDLGADRDKLRQELQIFQGQVVSQDTQN